MSKYGAIKTVVDGITFASKREAKRYSELKLLERYDEISELELQPRYDFRLNGMFIGFYKADFRYRNNRTGEIIIEDSKGMATPVYRLKKKMMKAFHNIEVTEV